MKPTIRAALFPILVALPACATLACWQSDGLDRLQQQYPDAFPDVADVAAGEATEATDPGAGDAVDSAIDVVEADVAADGVTTDATEAGDSAFAGMQGTVAFAFVQYAYMLGWDMVITDVFLGSVDGGGNASLQFCKEDIVFQSDTGGIGQTTMSQKLIDALGAAKLTLVVDGAGIVDQTKLAWTWGVKLDHPLTDAMPTGAGDATQWDQDADGNPGVTIGVVMPAGDRYMGRRALWTASTGTSPGGAPGEWRVGPLAWTVEQSIFGATDPILNTAAAIADRDPPVPGRWVMHQLSGATDCATLLTSFPAVVTPPTL